MAEGTGSLAILYAAGGLGSCTWVALLLYNVFGLVGYLRSASADGSASSLSKAAWAVGFLSFLAGPCAWLVALIAIGMATFERRRIYQDRSTYASATPCRHATVNGATVLAITGLMALGVASTWF